MWLMYTTAELCTADGKPMGKCNQIAVAPLALAGRLSEDVECLVISISYDIILGNSWLAAHFAEIHVAQHMLWLQFDGVEHTIYLNAAASARTPVVQTIRQQTQSIVSTAVVSVAKFAKELKERSDIESIGWISPVKSEDAVSPVDMATAAVSTHDDAVQHLLAKYANIMAKPTVGQPIPNGPEMEIVLKEGTELIMKWPYCLSQAENEELEWQLKDLQDKGYIWLSTSPWGTLVLFAKKKGGTFHLCIDYRVLNNAMVWDAFPMLRIEDLIDETRGARIFSKVDLPQAYHQVRVCERDIPKTAFRVKQGSFEYMVIPFGLTNAPAIFQRTIEGTLQGLLGKLCVVYLEDILIF